MTMIRIKVASYALKAFIWACHCSGIKDITVATEDSELVVYIKVEVPKGDSKSNYTSEVGKDDTK